MVGVLVVNTSAWVDGWSVGFSGLLTSIAVAWDLVDVCERLVWGM
jgi:hypothetical protein